MQYEITSNEDDTSQVAPAHINNVISHDKFGKNFNEFDPKKKRCQ